MPQSHGKRVDPSQGPSLDFDWELSAYRALRGIARALLRRGAQGAADPNAAHLAAVEPRLTVLARVLTESEVRIRPAKAEGGVVGRTLLLPTTIAVADVLARNVDVYVLRTALSSMLFLQHATAGAQSRLDAARAETASVRTALEMLRQSWPGFFDRWQAVCTCVLAGRPDPRMLAREEGEIERLRQEILVQGADCEVHVLAKAPADRRSPPVVLWGSLRPNEVVLDEDLTDDAANPPERNARQRKVKTVDTIELVKLDEKELETNVVQHSFEKVETADDYHGGARDLDGSDQLDEHAEASEELDLGKVVRSSDPVHAVLSADVSVSADIPDVETVLPGERGIPYDEWDGKRHDYLHAWCTVYPTQVRAADLVWHLEPLAQHRRKIDELRRRIEVARTRRAVVQRQRDGESIDLDAVVHHLSSLRADEYGAPRLYRQKRKRERDVALLVLLDVSLSSDAWVADRRVLDVAREAVLVLGEVTASLGDAISIFAFASHTRTTCRVFEIMGRGTPWPVARARLGALQPQGYTRIGPALRHATSELARQPERHKLLLMIGDGKPTDYDRYEGRHGIADVRQAVREADRVGVRIHGLTIDPRAGEMMPAMLGPGRYHVLLKVDELVSALTMTYEQLCS
ncbi:MAG: hypothetical protein FWD73_02040 [Polyangiaceae bacterium]|nr:hypothetical protein [Polyangiaceae bacterium]